MPIKDIYFEMINSENEKSINVKFKSLKYSIIFNSIITIRTEIFFATLEYDNVFGIF